MNIKRLIMVSSVMLSVLLSAGVATDAHAQQRTVAGILEETAAIGGETPGWAVRLEEPIVLGGRVYDSMEVYSGGEDLSPLAGKRVSATGTFVQWRTPERGKFIVLEVCEIIEAGRR